MLLTGKRALVTGGVGVIGAAIANRLASFGAEVVVVDLDVSSAQRVADAISERYQVKCYGRSTDVSDLGAVQRLADELGETVGVIDIIVPNAGVLVTKPATEISEAEWNSVLNVNLTGAFNVANVFTSSLQSLGQSGSVVFTSSLFGLRGGADNTAYSASKFGIIGVAQSMAAELASAGIRVNTVCPGQIETPMLNGLFKERAAQNGSDVTVELQTFVQRIPIGRLGLPDEIANTYVYLASELSSYVTGETILVDGGWQVG